MLTTGSTGLAVSRGQQTWYHSMCYMLRLWTSQHVWSQISYKKLSWCWQTCATASRFGFQV